MQEAHAVQLYFVQPGSHFECQNDRRETMFHLILGKTTIKFIFQPFFSAPLS